MKNVIKLITELSLKGKIVAVIVATTIVGGSAAGAIIINNKNKDQVEDSKVAIASSQKETTDQINKAADQEVSKNDEKKPEENKENKEAAKDSEEKKENTSENEPVASNTTTTNSSSKTSSSNTTTAPKPSTNNNAGATSKPSTPTPTPAPQPTPAPTPAPKPSGAQPPSGYNGESKMYNSSLSQQVNGTLGLNKNTAFYSTIHPVALNAAMADDTDAFMRDPNTGFRHFVSSLNQKQGYLYSFNGQNYGACRYYANSFNINSNNVSAIISSIKSNGLTSIENILGTELDQTYFETFVIWDNSSKTNKVCRVYMTFCKR